MINRSTSGGNCLTGTCPELHGQEPNLLRESLVEHLTQKGSN